MDSFMDTHNGFTGYHETDIHWMKSNVRIPWKALAAEAQFLWYKEYRRPVMVAKIDKMSWGVQ